MTILAETAGNGRRSIWPARRRPEEQLATATIDMDAERARIALMVALIRQQVAAKAKARS